MGRKAALTPKQWREVEDRYLSKGEGGRALAAEYGITEGAIRKRLGTQKRSIEVVANQLVTAELNLKKLDISTQVRTLERRDYLLSISMNLQSSASKGSAVAERLSTLAEKHMGIVETAYFDNDVEQVIEGIKTVNAMMRTANESSSLAVELVKVNKETVERLSQPEQEKKAKTLSDFYAKS